MRTEYIAAAAILVAVAIGLYVWSVRKKAVVAERKQTAAQRGPIEHAICQPSRDALVRYRAELANTPESDPLRRGNISGAIAVESAALAECERVESRNEAA